MPSVDAARASPWRVQAASALNVLLTGLSCCRLQVVRSARALTQPLFYRGGSNLRRMYEAADLPDRLVVVGDSLCSFNPVRSSSTVALPQFCDACQKGRVS